MNRRQTETEERRLVSYHRVHVPWDEHDGGVNVYFTDDVGNLGDWVVFLADGWLWSKEPGGANHTEYFDVPQRMALPRDLVRVVYWPEESA